MINVNDYLKKLEKDHFVLTKFLDAEESSLLHQLKNPHIEIFFNGGYDGAERMRAFLIKKNDAPPTEDEFEISLLKVIPCSLTNLITHRHVLGTVLSLGIKREAIGDIVINQNDDKAIYIFVDKIMENYIKSNLTKINNNLVEVSVVDAQNFEKKIIHNEQLINIASLRLDGVLSHAMKIGRTKAEKLIEMGDVQINHLECTNPSKQLKINDLISIKHFGRITILNIVNTTKKQRLIVKIDIKH